MSDIKPSEQELKAARAIADDYCPCNDIVHDIGSPLQAITCGSCEAVEETLAAIIAQHTRYEGHDAAWWCAEAEKQRLAMQANHVEAHAQMKRAQRAEERAEKAEAELQKAQERITALESALAGRTVSCVCGTDEFKRKAQAEMVRYIGKHEKQDWLLEYADEIESGAVRVGENDEAHRRESDERSVKRVDSRRS